MSQQLYSDTNSVFDDITRCISTHESSIVVKDEQALRDGVIDTLIYSAVFSENDNVKEASRTHIYNISSALGCTSASIHPLYMAFGRGEVQGCTVPAINLRTLTYDTARRVFALAKEKKVGAFIFEIAQSEQKYTYQTPAEFSCCIMAAAIKEGYRGPIFIQGDHYQTHKENYSRNADQEIQVLKDLIKSSLDAHFRNIDIDASTLVDLQKQDIAQQQEQNFTVTAELTQYIRRLQPHGIDISVGGEIGHIGGKNSTPEEFRAFMNGYKQILGNDVTGLSKISIQTGTSHGGKVLPDGTLADVAVDFNVLKDIGALARQEYGLGGTVQHGASTLHRDMFHVFPEIQTLEVHLSTEFQNIVYNHLNSDMKSKMHDWTRENAKSDWKEGMTEDQFLYKAQKRALGPFKKDLWDLPKNEKQVIMSALDDSFSFLFRELKVENTFDIVKKYIPL